MVTPVKVGIIGGSGFYKLESLEDKVTRDDIETPFGRPSCSPVEGRLGGVEVVVLARHGLNHSITPADINNRANIWALHHLGVTHILAATACGSLKEEIPPGMFVVLDSFIDRTQARAQSFYGGDGLTGVCHVPMEPAFCPQTRDCVISSCTDLGYLARHTGTAITIQGPRFSSRAESHLFRSWGCDVINMTTVPEVVLAKEIGISYASIALVTDYDCWRETHGVVDQQSVMKVFADNVSRVKTLIEKVVQKIGNKDWKEVIENNKKVASSSVISSG